MKNEFEHNNNFLNDLNLNKNPFKTPDNYFGNLSSSITSKNTTSDFPKSTGFKAPGNYFEILTDSIKSKQITSELPNVTGFKAPDNYFDHFKVNKNKFRIIKLVPYISVAAAIMVGVFLFNASNNNTLKRNEFIEYLAIEENIDESDIINYIGSNINSSTDIDGVNINIEELTIEIEDYDLIDF